MPVGPGGPLRDIEFPEIRFPVPRKTSTPAVSGPRFPFPTMVLPPAPPLVAAPMVVSSESIQTPM